MPSVSAILVPIDFSERSAPAARYAQSISARLGCPVRLLHALAPLQQEFSAGEIGGAMFDQLQQQRRARAAEEMKAFAAAAGIADWSVVEGDPAQTIVKAAHETAGLIMIPTHGYGPFRRFILGSTAAKVLHDADCPVWTGVHLESAPDAAAPQRRVLCAVDLGPQSSKTLFWAASLALQFGAPLTLLHVTLGAPGPARVELERLLSFVNADAELCAESGNPAAAICAAAERTQADVLVIGRGSAAGIFGRLRANAYSIIRQSPCPVVSV
jgi:nucleotide-binding universal stress UspA family protein